MRVDPSQWRALDLEVHELLKQIPLQDVSMVELPGGGAGRSLEDVRGLLLQSEGRGASPAVRALFALRDLLGRVFGWDRGGRSEQRRSLPLAIPERLRSRSLRPPGSADGPFTLLYQLDREMLSEIRNTTVHAFSCMVLVEHPGGYRFYWGVYVEPVSWITAFYMALIEPFRRFIVYPSLLRRLAKGWEERAKD